MRRFLLIGIIVLLALSAVFGVVYFVNGPITTPQPAPDDERTPRQFTPLPLDGTEGSNSGTVPNEVSDDVVEELFFSRDLTQFWGEPVSGATFVNDNTIRLVERATGHVYDVDTNTRAHVFVSNTTIPKIQEVVWDTPHRFIARYVNENTGLIESFAATLPANATTTVDLGGTFLPTNIRSVAAHDGKIAYVREKSVVTTNFDGAPPQNIKTLPVGEWQIFWFDDTTLGLLTAPQEQTLGYLYTLPETGGTMNLLIKDTRGLTILPNMHDLALYRTAFTGGVYDFGEQNYFEISPYLVPDACVWGTINTDVVYCGVLETPPSTYPDSWYQGVSPNTDVLWRFNIFSDALYAFELPESTHMSNLSVSPSENKLLFIDRMTGMLSLLDVSIPG